MNLFFFNHGSCVYVCSFSVHTFAYFIINITVKIQRKVVGLGVPKLINGGGPNKLQGGALFI